MTRRWALESRLMDVGPASRFLDDLRYTNLVAGYYVGAPLSVLTALNDFSLWFFIWDDQHDRLIARREDGVWRRLRDDLHQALDSPHKRLGNPDPLVASFADCTLRLRAPLSDSWGARFNEHFHATIDAYDLEYGNRTAGSVPSLDEYLSLRQHTFGMWTWIDCLELAAEYELPREVYASAPYQAAGLASQEFSAWFNDLHSMRKELAATDFHNFGITLAHQECIPLQEAVEHLAKRVQQRITDFMTSERHVRALLDELRAAPQLRAGTERCLFNMRNWISSVYWFHYESSRYQVESWDDPARPPYVHDLVGEHLEGAT